MKNMFEDVMLFIQITVIFFFLSIFAFVIGVKIYVEMNPDKFPTESQVIEQVETSSVEEVNIPTAEQIEQEKMLEQVKRAEGHSVLLRTEKIGDDVKPMTVRHYARWTELGQVEYWTEQVKE